MPGGGSAPIALAIESGGMVSNFDGLIAAHVNVEVTDSGSTWINSNRLSIFGGRVSVDAGAAVSSSIGVISGSIALARVELAGSGSIWSILDSLYVGGDDIAENSQGTLTVESGATVDVANTLKVWAPGIINLDGGTISAGTVETAGTTLNWTSGTFEITGLAGLSLGSNSFFPALTTLASGQILDVTNTLTIDSGQLLSLAGGNVKAGTVALNGGNIVGTTLDFDGISNLTGTGLVAAPIAGTAPASTITATGALTIGDGTSASGFDYGGTLNVGTNQVIILDANAANLGNSTNLGAGGLLQALNGSALSLGETLTATGDTTVTGDFLNDGTVNGPVGPGEFLTFHDDVTGSGNYTGSILFDDNFSPGSSPAAVSLDNAAIMGSLTIELGGLIPGTDFDVLNFGDTATLGGILDVQLINGFTPMPGDAFTFIQAAMVDDTFDTLLFPNAPGVVFNVFYGLDNVTLAASAIPLPTSVWLFSSALAGLGFVMRGKTAGV